MRRILPALLAAALTVAGLVHGQQPEPVPKAFFRGARSARAHWLAAEATNHPAFRAFPRAVPPKFTPAVILAMDQMSYWLNNQDGDCVTAEECAAICVYPVWYSAAGLSQRVVIDDATVRKWCQQRGYLNGANLTDVMDSMTKDGMAYNGVTYRDGPYKSVDYTDWATLTSAIYTGPVKIGMAANQLSGTDAGNRNGWIGTGWKRDQNVDHCTALWGYGTMTELCSALNVTPPANAAQYTQCCLFYTWDTIGIVDFASIVNTSDEAWIRTPTDTQITPPQPNPNPTGLAWALGAGAPAGAALDQNGNFTWTIPASQPAGQVAISFTVTPTGGAPVAGSFTIVVSAAGGGPVVITPIPQQTAAAGQSFALGLGQYVQSKPGGPNPPQPEPMPLLPDSRTPVRPSPQSPGAR